MSFRWDELDDAAWRVEVEDRLSVSLQRADLGPELFVKAMIPSMFGPSAPEEAVERFAASRRAFQPAGFRCMAHASAEADLRDVLPTINVPTLLLYGDQDVRAPLNVANALHSAIPGSRLVIMRGVGHVSPVEAPELFNREVRAFLRSNKLRLHNPGERSRPPCGMRMFLAGLGRMRGPELMRSASRVGQRPDGHETGRLV